MEELCLICRSPTTEDKDTIICPYCEGSFHRDHLEDWLQGNKQCPLCRQDLSLLSITNGGVDKSKWSMKQGAQIQQNNKLREIRQDLQEIPGSSEIVERISFGQCSVCGSTSSTILDYIVDFPFCSVKHLAYYKPGEVLLMSIFTFILGIILFTDFVLFPLYNWLFILPVSYFFIKFIHNAFVGSYQGAYHRKVMDLIQLLRASRD